MIQNILNDEKIIIFKNIIIEYIIDKYYNMYIVYTSVIKTV